MGQPATQPETDAKLGPYSRGAALCVILLAAYIAVIVGLHTDTATRSTAPPWYSWFRIPPARGLLQRALAAIPAIVFGAWFALVRRTQEKKISPAQILAAAVAAVFLFNITIAMMDGSSAAIWRPFDRPGSEYFSDVASVHGVASFLREYVRNLPHYGVHSQTHPPGAVLFLYFVARLVGPGVKIAAWAAVMVTATGIVPFYLLARRLGGEKLAAIAIALYPLAPSLVLFGATSMDGVFLIPILWSAYFLQRTATDSGFISPIAAALALSISLMFSYATVCIGGLIFIYAILECLQFPNHAPRMAARFLVCATLIVLVLWAVDLSTGFNYLACLQESRAYDHYLMNTSHISPGRYLDISVSNLVAFLIGVGLPAVVLGSREIRRSIRRETSVDRFNLATLIALFAFSFAGLFTHETERVWMFLIPLALLPAAVHISRAGMRQRPLLEWTMALLFIQTWLFQLLLFTIW